MAHSHFKKNTCHSVLETESNLIKAEVLKALNRIVNAKYRLNLGLSRGEVIIPSVYVKKISVHKALQSVGARIGLDPIFQWDDRRCAPGKTAEGGVFNLDKKGDILILAGLFGYKRLKRGPYVRIIARFYPSPCSTSADGGLITRRGFK